MLIQDHKRRNAHAFNLGVRTLYDSRGCRFVCIQKCHLRAALDIQFIRMTRLDIASSARAESKSTETPRSEDPWSSGHLRCSWKGRHEKSAKGPHGGTHDDGQQERWDQIKRGRKLSSSIMSSANLKGESVARTAPHKKGNRTKDHCEEEEEGRGLFRLF